MKSLIALCIIFACSHVGAQDISESVEFANATFTGTVTYLNREPLMNGRFCGSARKLPLQREIPLVIEGGQQGEQPFFSYGTVNGQPGLGFYSSKYKDLPAGMNYLTEPVGGGLFTPKRRGPVCGISQLNTQVLKVNDNSALVNHTIYVGCNERGSRGKPGRFYLCYQRNYQGEFVRVP